MGLSTKQSAYVGATAFLAFSWFVWTNRDTPAVTPAATTTTTTQAAQPTSQPMADSPTLATTSSPMTGPAEPDVFALKNFGLVVKVPAERRCRRNDTMDGELVDIRCDGKGKLQIWIARMGDNKSIDAFEKDVLSGPGIKGKERPTRWGGKVLMWGELNEVDGYTSHAVLYRNGAEIALNYEGSQFDAVAPFNFVITNLSNATKK